MKHLGFLSAAPPERSIELVCRACDVSWTGCQDAAECPQCGSTESYEEQTRRFYQPEEPAEEPSKGTCAGGCCARFWLPYSKEVFMRHAQEGVKHNGTVKETWTIARMLVPLDGGKGRMSAHGRRFAFTCRHFIGGRCSIYPVRPVVCRRHPTENEPFNTLGGCSLDERCTLNAGTPDGECDRAFREGRP